MNEAYVSGMQGDASVGIGTRSPVFQVSLDDASHAGELAPDLVMSPREQFDLQQMITFRVAEITVA